MKQTILKILGVGTISWDIGMQDCKLPKSGKAIFFDANSAKVVTCQGSN